LLLFELFFVQLTSKVRDLLAQRRVLRPQNLNLALQRGNQVPNLGSENHPYVDSYRSPRVPQNHPPSPLSKKLLQIRLTPPWELHYLFESRATLEK